MDKYYQILGLSAGADKASVRSAYRRLVKVYHPDVNSSLDANEKFLQITEAYDALYYGKFPQRRTFSYQQSNRSQSNRSQNNRPKETAEQRRKRIARAKAKRAEAKAKKEKEEFEKTYLYDFIQIFSFLGKIAFLLITVFFLFITIIGIFNGFYNNGIFYFLFLIDCVFSFIIFSYRKTYFKLKLKNIKPQEFKNLFKKRESNNQSCFFTSNFVDDGPAYLFRLYKTLDVKTFASTPLNHKILTKTKVRRVHVARSLFAYKVHLAMKMVRWGSVIFSFIFLPLESVVWCFTFGVFISIFINQLISFFTKVKSDFYFFTNYYTLIRFGIVFFVLILDTETVNSQLVTSESISIWLILLYIITDFIITPLVVEIKGNKLLRALGKKKYSKISQFLDEGYQVGYMESFPSALYSVYKWFF